MRPGGKAVAYFVFATVMIAVVAAVGSVVSDAIFASSSHKLGFHPAFLTFFPEMLPRNIYGLCRQYRLSRIAITSSHLHPIRAVWFLYQDLMRNPTPPRQRSGNGKERERTLTASLAMPCLAGKKYPGVIMEVPQERGEGVGAREGEGVGIVKRVCVLFLNPWSGLCVMSMVSVSLLTGMVGEPRGHSRGQMLKDEDAGAW
ncbi:hypothetical protein DFH27DRAFT_578636 [Peziza echinospora]|nr:hypothetical protein DFH27DRAFT_578636 [Peziza echinospora]